MNLPAGQCLQNVYLIKNRFRYYRGIDCIKKLCKNLKDHALEIINCEKKEISLTQEENRFYEEQEIYATYVKKSFFQMKMMKIMKMKMMKFFRLMKSLKNTKKLKITVITQENLEELLIVFAI